MNEQTWTNIDKTAWAEGPWTYEPDKVQWVDEATGLDCLAVRNESSGHWCGYVGVPNGHRLYGTDYGDVRVAGEHPDVHGGLTFSNTCDEDAAEGHGICHVPLPGRPGDVWWLGFDCAHYLDLSPADLNRYPVGAEDEYRDLRYVRRETERLAAQIASSS